MRKVFLVLAGLMLLATVVLIFFAGVGAFDTAPKSESFEPHRMVGRGLFVLSLLAIGAAALARAPGRLIGLTALVTGLVFLQSVIAVVSGAFDGAGDQSTATGNLVFGLHALNGVVTMGVAHSVFMGARRLAGKPEAGEAEPAEPATPAASPAGS